MGHNCKGQKSELPRNSPNLLKFLQGLCIQILVLVSGIVNVCQKHVDITNISKVHALSANCHLRIHDAQTKNEYHFWIRFQ